MDDDDSGDHVDDGDDVEALLCVVRKIPLFSLPIPPSDEPRRLGLCLLDEFLVSLGVRSTIQFYEVEIVDSGAAMTLHTTAHTRGHSHMKRCLLPWKRNDDVFFGLLAWFFYGRQLSL